MDLTNQQNIIRMARESTTRIDSVPFFVLYINGKPYAKFTGKQKTLASLKQFVTNTLNAWQQEQSFVQQPAPQQQQQNMYTQHGNASVPTSTYSPKMPPKGQVSKHLEQCDPETNECQIPKHTIPHNMPWESDFRKYIEHGSI